MHQPVICVNAAPRAAGSPGQGARTPSKRRARTAGTSGRAGPARNGPVGSPAAEVGGYPLEEFPAASPEHQRNQRGVVPADSLVYRRVHADVSGARSSVRSARKLKTCSYDPKIFKLASLPRPGTCCGAIGGSGSRRGSSRRSALRSAGQLVTGNNLVRGGPAAPSETPGRPGLAAEHLAPRCHRQADERGMVASVPATRRVSGRAQRLPRRYCAPPLGLTDPAGYRFRSR